MKVIVDADACPTKEIIINISKKYNVPVVFVVDTTHILSYDYVEIVTVDKGKDSADIEVANRTQRGDIVVTQDFGVAAMCLGKSAYVLGNNGFIYNDNNIERLLFERHLSQKVRRSGGKTKNPSKRSILDDTNFEKQFEKIMKIALSI